MGDLLNIFSGPAQVNLYDSTNGVLCLGHLGEDDVKLEPVNESIGTSSGNAIDKGTLYKFTCALLQTDSTFLSNLRTRRAYQQTIYVIASGMLLKLSNIYFTIGLNRNCKGGESHKFMITAMTRISADVESIINLLGSDGNCNTEVGTSGLATGWAVSGPPSSYDVEASHISGRGNQQYVIFDDADQMIYYDVVCPLDQVPVKITVSAYVEERTDVSAADFLFGIKTKNSSDVVVDNQTSQQTLTSGQETRISKEISFTPGADIKTISVYFEDNGGAAADIGFDDVQLEFGELTDFTDNDTE